MALNFTRFDAAVAEVQAASTDLKAQSGTISFTRIDAAVAELQAAIADLKAQNTPAGTSDNPFGLSASTLAKVLASGTSPVSNPALAVPAGSKVSFYLMLKQNGGTDTPWGNVVMLGNNVRRVYSRGTDADGTLLQDDVVSLHLPVDNQPHLVEFVRTTAEASALSGLRFSGDGGWSPFSTVTILGYVITKDVLTAAEAEEVRTKMQAGGSTGNPPPPTGTDPRTGRSVVFTEQFASLAAIGEMGTAGPAGAQFWVGPKPSMYDSGQFGNFKFSNYKAGEFGHNPFSVVNDVVAEDGKALQIQAKWLDGAMNAYTTNPKWQWVSGLVATANLNRGTGSFDNLIGFDHGYFVCRMKVPLSPYSWPAFWLLNRDGSLPPFANSIELDVIEHKGSEPKNYGAYYHQWNPAGPHVGLGPHLSASGGPRNYASADDVDLTTGYHDYGMLLDNDFKLTFYIDHMPIKDSAGNVVTFTLADTAMASRGDKFFMLLNLAGLDELPDPWPTPTTAQQTINLLIDYVKVYA